MNKKFIDETDGQLDFYNRFLIRVDKNLSLEDILSDNNDGIINGNIIEFKLNINDINSVLFQAIKYLSAMRIKGKSIPANIVLISLNTEKAYIYDSESYLKEIETIYTGSASKNNSGFTAHTQPIQLDYSSHIHAEDLITTLKSSNYIKINIDENCIIGWATRFYKENPKAKKQDFIGDEGKIKIVGEIRNPVHFKNFINPYQGGSDEKFTNEKFRYLMDKLNDELSKKDLGAFYTPKQYVELSTELVRQAIARVPEGNDYIILDRCAGTGNLEQFLTKEELSHCVISTYEYYEYKVLMELYGDKVRHVIPPVDDAELYHQGTVLGADALSKEYIENALINRYIKNEKCTIILLENPPYAEAGSVSRDKENAVTWKNSYAVSEMKKEISGTPTNDLANVFIWSAFKYYLRQDTDSYILYSPIKYWKSQKVVNNTFLNGYAFNRKHFHTNTDAMISCILWSNKKDITTQSFNLKAFNIVDDKILDEGNIEIKRVHNTISKMFSDKILNNNNGIVCELNGLESFKTEKQITCKKTYNPDIVAYLVSDAFGFDNPRLTASLLRCGRYNGHGSFITIHDYLRRLPLFSASRYTDNNNNWKIMSQLMKTSDGKEEYIKDCDNGKLNDFLLKNLLWICLTNQSHMRSLNGSDGRFYRNDLCLDDTNGDTLASKELKKLKPNNTEENLLKQWNDILVNAKLTSNYNPEYSYGIYQIEVDLNTCKKVKDSKNKWFNVYDYPILNGQLNTLKATLKDYYLTEIAPTLYKYQLLK